MKHIIYLLMTWIDTVLMIVSPFRASLKFETKSVTDLRIFECNARLKLYFVRLFNSFSEFRIFFGLTDILHQLWVLFVTLHQKMFILPSSAFVHEWEGKIRCEKSWEWNHMILGAVYPLLNLTKLVIFWSKGLNLILLWVKRWHFSFLFFCVLVRGDQLCMN